MVETGVRMTKRPNVDLGLGALTFVAGLPDDIEPFAVARLAGFAAHLQEELEERPVRYRGLARAKPPDALRSGSWLHVQPGSGPRRGWGTGSGGAEVGLRDGVGLLAGVQHGLAVDDLGVVVEPLLVLG